MGGPWGSGDPFGTLACGKDHLKGGGACSGTWKVWDDANMLHRLEDDRDRVVPVADELWPSSTGGYPIPMKTLYELSLSRPFCHGRRSIHSPTGLCRMATFSITTPHTRQSSHPRAANPKGGLNRRKPHDHNPRSGSQATTRCRMIYLATPMRRSRRSQSRCIRSTTPI